MGEPKIFLILFPPVVTGRLCFLTTGDNAMPNYADKLRALGLSRVQIVTILSGWTFDAIERLLRGELSPPSDNIIVRAEGGF